MTTISKPKMCLNMIVKNEGEIIAKSLSNLIEKLPVDYWVISDTGSTDNTIEEITNFFKEKNINGEIFRDEWKDFAHNRTLALQYAYNKSDYLCIFDADDKIIGNIQLPDILDKDSYNLGFGNENGITYTRPLIINNKKKWEFKGVLHEYLACLDNLNNSVTLGGNYYIRHNALLGDRTKMSQKEKYMKDALILEKAYKESFEKDDKIYERYAFYCGNSFKDCQEYAEAIKWYKIVLTHNNWDQEKYISCMRIFECYRELKQRENGFYYLVEAYKYDTTRVECVYELIMHYCANGMHNIAFNYYSLYKNLYEINNNDVFTNGKLFLDISKAYFYLPYQLLIVSYYTNEFDTGIKMYKEIFKNKYREFNEFFVKHIFLNLQFYIEKIDSNDSEFFILYKEYIDFLIENNYPLINHYKFLQKYEKYGCYIPEILKMPNFNQEECKNSNKILFFIGFSNIYWNYTFSLTNALGGSERAIINLSQQFPKNYEIYITGEVEEETVGNIKYVNLSNLPNLIKSNAFHTIIVSRYINFFENYYYFCANQTYIWAHDTCLHNYTSSLSHTDLLKKWENKINGCICQTEWHKNDFIIKYPELVGKIFTINNGITIENFKYEPEKIKNRFIYSSCSERGLNVILKLWPEIIKVMPNAELLISSYNNFPRNDYENQLYEIIKKYDNIHHLGKLNNDKLYELMSTAEYWLYPTYWPETSCITAMEMLMNQVICIYYPIAGLVNTLGDYGIPIQEGNEIETILSLTDERKNEIKKRGYEYALSCSWQNRYQLWSDILFKKNKENLVFYISPDFKIKALYDYFDSLKEKYNITFTNDYNELFNIKDSLILFTINFLNENIIEQFINNNNTSNNYGFINTEPLNIPHFLNLCISINKKYPKNTIYDYSESNIEILNIQKIKNVKLLKYEKTIKENDYLTNLNNSTEKIYDFGIIGSDEGSDIKLLGPRREKIVRILLEKNFTVNVISGWKNERDIELSKCKIILNIHGQIKYKENASIYETTLIFEHIRCNRLLDAGFKILSENVLFLNDKFKNEYPNLKFIPFEEFKNINKSILNDDINEMWQNILKIKINKPKYCFIQSCNLKDKGVYRLENIINILNKSGCINIFNKIYIINIGIPIENKYGDIFEIINYSENTQLYEIPAINLIKEFSENNLDSYILYLHTKGVSYSNDYIQENDWINYMLYFLVEKYENCISLLDMSYESLGCNYSNDFDKEVFSGCHSFPPSHYSGNFWWANTNHLKTLPKIPIENINKDDAEFWLFNNNHKYLNLHNSNINHYKYYYPRENYEK
jgi:hypothetical protein